MSAPPTIWRLSLFSVYHRHFLSYLLFFVNAVSSALSTLLLAFYMVHFFSAFKYFSWEKNPTQVEGLPYNRSPLYFVCLHVFTNISFSCFLKGMQPCQHLGFSPVRPWWGHVIVDLDNYNILNLWGFRC